MRSRSSASTTSSARRAPRTCTSCASPTGFFAARSGGANTSGPGADRRARGARRRRSSRVLRTPPGQRLDMLVTPSLSRLPPRWQWSRLPAWRPADLQAARESVLACFRPLDPARTSSSGSSRATATSRGVDITTPPPTRFVAGPPVGGHRPVAGVPFLLRTGKRMACTRPAGEPALLRTPEGPVPRRCPNQATSCR